MTPLQKFLLAYTKESENFIFNSEKDWKAEFEEFKKQLRLFWVSRGVEVNW